MKKTIYTVMLLAAAMMTTGCSDWLDVSPKTEVREDDLFASEEGYDNAVAGVYILLGKTSLYGAKTTLVVPEFLAHTWETPSASKNNSEAELAHYLADYDYTNSTVETELDALWSNYYNAIAQINNILANLETSSVHFTGNRRQMMLGELYGLRAFLHLDLLRLYGPVPTTATDQTEAIPYVTEMTTDVAKLQSKTYADVRAAILADLDKAESTLQDCDPLVKTHLSADNPTDSNNPYAAGDDETVSLADYETYRQLHFNYWAVLGAKARLYYWTGDKQKAVEYAKKVINATDADGKQIFHLCDESYLSSTGNANLNMKMEHLFGVYNSSFDDEIVADYFSDANCLCTQSEDYIKDAYEVSLYPDDIRFKTNRYWKQQMSTTALSTLYKFLKYFMYGSRYGSCTLPVMRLSEMYFIVFEDASISDMKPLFATWRLARGLDASIDETLTSASAVQSRMEKEWRKEFMGEGQMFYFYKQHNYPALTWPTTYTVPAGGYVVPKPQSQTMYE